MAIVTISDMHKSFGSEIVFDSLNLQMHAGEKVGMVGANGTGKSTIFKLIIGDITLDMGKVIKQKSLQIGYLPQEPIFDPELTVIEQMHVGLEDVLKLQKKIETAAHDLETLKDDQLKNKMVEYDRLCHKFEMAGGYRYEAKIKSTLAGLGFDQQLFHAKTKVLSGGQLSRLGLAKVLMLETDILLLDEPTNHLDLQATEWLEKYLINYNGAVVIISHDRFLLDRVSQKIIEIANGQANIFKGNYSDYIKARERFLLEKQREHQARVEMVEKTRDFIARNKDQEGMRKTARGRKTRLNKMLKENPDFLDSPVESKKVYFKFDKAVNRSQLVLRCEDLSKSFDDLTLFKDLTFDVLRGERFGITGPNGTGKSTFIKLALKQIEPTSGVVRLGENLKVGYLDQNGIELNADNSVIEEARQVRPDLQEGALRKRLAAFLLTGDDVFKKCGNLSGGQQSRLILCKLVLKSPDVLILDEPTNHLDIQSREMLEDALNQYEGTVIAVSHDRYFLDRILDKLLVIGVDSLGKRSMAQTQHVQGQPVYSRYAYHLYKRIEKSQLESGKSKTAKKSSSKASDKKNKTPKELKRFNKYKTEKLEQMIIELEERVAETKEQFGSENVYKNPQLLTELQTEYDSMNDELALMYQAYERREK